MICPTRTLTACVTAAVLLAGAGVAKAEPYHSTTHHFTVDLPYDWEPVTKGEVKRVNAFLRKNIPDFEMSVVAVFRPIDVETGQLPFVVVMEEKQATVGMTFEELERDFASPSATGKPRDKRSPLRATGVSLSAPTFDRDRKRFSARGRLAIEGGPRIGAQCYGYLGQDGMLMLYGYADEKTFQKHQPTFVAMGDSFQFDNEQKAGGAVGPLFERVFGTPVSEKQQMAIVGSGTTLLVWMFGALLLRGSSSRAFTR